MVNLGRESFIGPAREELTIPLRSAFWTAVMNQPKQTTPQTESSNGQSAGTKSFVEKLQAAREETIRKGIYLNYGLGEFVPRSSLNYPSDLDSIPAKEA